MSNNLITANHKGNKGKLETSSAEQEKSWMENRAHQLLREHEVKENQTQPSQFITRISKWEPKGIPILEAKF